MLAILREPRLVVYAFCCASNHVHLVPEARREQLSQVMSLVTFLYARYYNATRSVGRRLGALWAERFSAEQIDTK